jgi:hypothetical protein
MRIKDQSPLDYVDRNVYDDEESDSVALSEVVIGASYIARLIVNPLCEKDFAADYWVTVDDIMYPKPRRILPSLSTDTITVSLLYTPGDNELMDDAPMDTYAIAEDGHLFTRTKRLLRIFDTPRGYLLDDEDEMSDELQDWIRKGRPTPVNQPTLCLV